jgi:toxin-antitoxin system PIN domain toxin
MVAVDTNILVYAHRREASEHDAAMELLRTLAAGSSAWAIPWPCVYEFFSVVTNRRIWGTAASTPSQAWRQLDAWFSTPTLRLIGETEDFTAILADVAVSPRIHGPVIHDARIAAICVAHGIETLYTRDRDFSLFADVKCAAPF